MVMARPLHPWTTMDNPTRGLAWLTIVLVASFGCDGGEEGATDGGQVDSQIDAALTCVEVQEQFEAAIATLDRSCSSVQECTPAGGADYQDACDCNAYLPPHAVNRAAYQGSTASELEKQFREQCREAECGGAISCICDELELRARCSGAGQCETDYPSCGCGWCADAGVADAG